MTEPALPVKRTRRVAPPATAATDTDSGSPAAAKPKRVAKAAVKVAAPKPAAAKAGVKTATAKPVAVKTAKPAAATSAATADAAVPSADGLPRRAARATKAGDAAKAAWIAKQERPPLELARRIVELADDKKAADIVLLDLTALTTLADYFVICSGGSERQLDAIADGIVSTLRDEKTRPYGREGTAASHWVLVDYGSVVVHILTPPERDYYGLEKHWSEARTILTVQ